MATLPFIDENAPPHALPPVEQALKQPNGLLAAGGNLSPAWLLHAYRNGIFPWYDQDEPVLWWSPNPRAVLRPPDLHISRSLKKSMAKGNLRLSADTQFSEVVSACAAPRRDSSGTWITPEMHVAYSNLHNIGVAHSFEAWQNDVLVGGLYGLRIGAVFFGESMFSTVANASKTVFATAVGFLQHCGIQLIDCQVSSEHLASLGATTIPRSQFVSELAQLCAISTDNSRFPVGPISGPFAEYQRLSFS